MSVAGSGQRTLLSMAWHWLPARRVVAALRLAQSGGIWRVPCQPVPDFAIRLTPLHEFCHDVMMDGYMIDVQCDEEMLRVHAKSSAARFALTGAKTEAVMGDDGKVHVQTTRGSEDVVIPRANIVDVMFKGANPLVNGNLIVTTVDGKKYQLHFRRKQQDDFRALAKQLGVVLA